MEDEVADHDVAHASGLHVASEGSVLILHQIGVLNTVSLQRHPECSPAAAS